MSITYKTNVITYNTSPFARYGDILSKYKFNWSEERLIEYRLKISLDYIVALNSRLYPKYTPSLFDEEQLSDIECIIGEINNEYIDEIKSIEAEKKHDVVAIVEFLKSKFTTYELPQNITKYIHFGLTSNDLNNPAYTMMVRDHTQIIIGAAQHLCKSFAEFAGKNSGIAMLSYTHGQPATPTTVDYQIYMWVARVLPIISEARAHPYKTKFGGATGGHNALAAIYPDINWYKFSREFMVKYDLGVLPFTTQIDNYDNFADVLMRLSRLSSVLLAIANTIHEYICKEYFLQVPIAGECGSSTMPNKVNPVALENAIGNLEMCEQEFAQFAISLPKTKLQRTINDSVKLRNLGTPIAHLILSVHNIETEFAKLVVNNAKIAAELNAHPEILMEPIQLAIRGEFSRAYDIVKDFARGKPTLTLAEIHEFIISLKLKDPAKLLAMTPENYRPADYSAQIAEVKTLFNKINIV